MKYIPEGATHTAPDGTYRMLLGGYWRQYADGDWVIVKSPCTHLYTHIKDEVIELNTTKVVKWDGVGLPPVGSHVFVYDPDEILRYGQGEDGEVIAHVEDTAVIRMSYGLGCFESRCLRTADQIAAEEREKAVFEIAHILIDNRHDSAEYHQAGLIYDAGYRKQVEK